MRGLLRGWERAALALTLVAGAVIGSPLAVAAAPETSVKVTVTVQGGDACPWDLGCRVGVSIRAADSGALVLGGVLDPDAVAADPDASLSERLMPGTYEVRLTARNVIEDGTTVPVGSCGATLELLAASPSVHISAAMAWDQPACGIVIDPRAPGPERPELAPPILADGPPPRFRPQGRPTTTRTANGIRIDLWVKDRTLRQRQWLLGHARIKNVTDHPIRYAGRFAHLDCPPLRTEADTSGLFDPGRTWGGVAGIFKDRFFRDGILLRTGFSIPARDRGNGCGDVGYVNTLKPGQVVHVPLAGLPSYWLRSQPLPPGRIRVTVAFTKGGHDRVAVSTNVTLAGRAVGYPSPGQLVDTAISTPGFLRVLARSPDPREWANAHVSWWKTRPYPQQPRFAGAREAPAGILEIMQFLVGWDGKPFVVGAVVDPWTGESFGASGW